MKKMYVRRSTGTVLRTSATCNKNGSNLQRKRKSTWATSFASFLEHLGSSRLALLVRDPCRLAVREFPCMWRRPCYSTTVKTPTVPQHRTTASTTRLPSPAYGVGRSKRQRTPIQYCRYICSSFLALSCGGSVNGAGSGTHLQRNASQSSDGGIGEPPCLISFWLTCLLCS